jgi:Ca2+-binding RTX toxin-like protein
VFSLGDGQDTIFDADGTVGNIDTLRFGAGIVEADINLNLTLILPGDNDQLKIANYFEPDGYAGTAIDEIRFADGTVWDRSAILSLVQTGGTNQDDVVYGSEGNDTLDGGAGNDYLYGGLGNDVYLFGPGSGVNYISDADKTPGNMDTLRFSAGVLPTDVAISRSNEDLVLSLNGGLDQLTLMGWFSAKGYRVENIEFANGTVWHPQGINAQFPTTLIAGTEGDDVLYGTNENVLFNGGAGNDVLMGWAESDTYLFNLGDGQDTISEYDYDLDFVDAISFGGGIAADDIMVSQDGTSLLIQYGHSGNAAAADQITVENWGSAQSRIEQIKFADGTVQNDAWLDYLLTAAPAGTDKVVSFAEDFGFSSKNFGNYLSAVRIDSLPIAGTLTLGGTVVTASQVISTTDLAAGNLVFTPPSLTRTEAPTLGSVFL